MSSSHGLCRPALRVTACQHRASTSCSPKHPPTRCHITSSAARRRSRRCEVLKLPDIPITDEIVNSKDLAHPEAIATAASPHHADDAPPAGAARLDQGHYTLQQLATQQQSHSEGVQHHDASQGHPGPQEHLLGSHSQQQQQQQLAGPASAFQAALWSTDSSHQRFLSAVIEVKPARNSSEPEVIIFRFLDEADSSLAGKQRAGITSTSQQTAAATTAAHPDASAAAALHAAELVAQLAGPVSASGQLQSHSPSAAHPVAMPAPAHGSSSVSELTHDQPQDAQASSGLDQQAVWGTTSDSEGSASDEELSSAISASAGSAGTSESGRSSLKAVVAALAVQRREQAGAGSDSDAERRQARKPKKPKKPKKGKKGKAPGKESVAAALSAEYRRQQQQQQQQQRQEQRQEQQQEHVLQQEQQKPKQEAPQERLEEQHGKQQQQQQQQQEKQEEQQQQQRQQAEEGAASGLPPFELVKRAALAGGVLDLVRMEGERMLRVWLPPGYSREEAARHPYPLLLLNDGQNLFDDRLSFSGCSWRAAEAAAELIAAGLVPPFLVAGIDHAGADRSLEYLPYKPGSGPGGFRSDAAQWPGGDVARYMERVVTQVLPWLTEAYGAASDSRHVAFGGSSFGGICTLWACMHHGDKFDAALVESPSLWFGEERFFRQDLAQYAGPWPRRTFLAMGSKEYSGIRATPGPQWDDLLVGYCRQLADMLRSKGLDSSRLTWQIDEGASHTESAWAARLPAALTFLLQPWWTPALTRSAGRLFFTSPRRLQAGQPAVLFVDRSKSHVLGRGQLGKLQVQLGFNNWALGTVRLELQPAPQLEVLLEAGSSTDEDDGSWGVADPADVADLFEVASDLHAAEAEGQSEGGSVPAAAAAADAPAGGQQGEKGEAEAQADDAAHAAQRSDELGAPAAGKKLTRRQQQRRRVREEAALASRWPSRWQAVTFTVPPEAYEMHFALTDGQDAWDNNAGSDFYVRIKQPPGISLAVAPAQTREQVLQAAHAAVAAPVDEVASASSSRLFFTAPEPLVAGAPGLLYFNRARSDMLKSCPSLQAKLGFNNWSLEPLELDLKPTSLWQGPGVDWWASQVFQVPEEGAEVCIAFSDGGQRWDSNSGRDYRPAVRQVRELQLPQRRDVAKVEVREHEGGLLHVITLARRPTKDKASKEARWKQEKVLRVWTPPGYSKEGAPPGGWPLLVMNDGQNMFEDALAHQGHAWQVGRAAARLISDGAVPPFVVAAVDNAGPLRSLNYLPYKPGIGVGGFRMDAERWPGGGCEEYMRRLTLELMPLVQREFNTASDPGRVAFGGGSFAGVTALYAALHYPHVFGSVLVESPSLWVAEGAVLRDMAGHCGPLPERLFLGCGTREYSGTRQHARNDVDQLLLHYYHEAAAALQAAGLRGEQRLRFLVEEGAGHHELAWQWRLTGALQFLLAPWWEE